MTEFVPDVPETTTQPPEIPAVIQPEPTNNLSSETIIPEASKEQPDVKLGYLVLTKTSPQVFLEIGQHFDVYELDFILGSDPYSAIYLPHPHIQPHHVRIYWDAGMWHLRDLTNTLQVAIQDLPVKHHIFTKEGQSFQIADMEIKFFFSTEPAETYEENLYKHASTDGLTGLASRRIFDRYMQHELLRNAHCGQWLSVILLDMDHFHDVNDRYTHLGGDAVLKEIARRLTKRVRRHELVARYGGEELILALPNTTHFEAAEIAERICHMIASQPILFEDKNIAVTASIGVASTNQFIESKAFLKQADLKMYEAKRSGRNQVKS